MTLTGRIQLYGVSPYTGTTSKQSGYHTSRLRVSNQTAVTHCPNPPAGVQESPTPNSHKWTIIWQLRIQDSCVVVRPSHRSLQRGMRWRQGRSDEE